MNPFKEGSNQYKDFETMSDCKWHCSKCELLSGQAKTWQVWRQEKGIQLDQDESGNWYKMILCPNCGIKTVHRKLKSTEIVTENLKARTGIPAKVAKRAKELFGCVDEYSMRTEAAKVLEIDHRTPQVRWTTNEDDNSNLTDEQIKAKFMLLTSPNNLLKSRVCEECVKTNKRGKGYKEIEFWYVGDENYSDDIGCVGCFWHNPSEWRKELNKKIKEK